MPGMGTFAALWLCVRFFPECRSVIIAGSARAIFQLLEPIWAEKGRNLSKNGKIYQKIAQNRSKMVKIAQKTLENAKKEKKLPGK